MVTRGSLSTVSSESSSQAPPTNRLISGSSSPTLFTPSLELSGDSGVSGTVEGPGFGASLALP